LTVTGRLSNDAGKLKKTYKRLKRRPQGKGRTKRSKKPTKKRPNK
jgi:hypothetical protein